MRVPVEFVSWARTLDEDHAKQTGYPPNLTATLRRLSSWGSGKIITNGHTFDVAIFGRVKKRR